MEHLEAIVASLARRVEALEQENAQLRRATVAGPLPLAEVSPSRRHVLAGGVGLLGALVGAGALEPVNVASAAGSVATHSGAVRSPQFAQPTLVGIEATVAVQHSGGHHWARYEWDLAEHFSGAHAPVVVAAAADDYHGTTAASAPTCAVSVQREAGRYRAVILLGGLGHLASQVTLHALAFGQ